MPVFAVGVTGNGFSRGCISMIDVISFLDNNDDRYASTEE